MACLLIEPWDFTRPLYGNGCTAVSSSAVRNLGGRLKIVGVASEGEIGQWRKLKIHGMDLDFLPVIHADAMKSPRFLSANLEFALAVRRHMDKIRAAGVPTLLTRTYPVLWFFTFLEKGWDVAFYYPGLGNPMLVGRRPVLGRFLALLYERIQAKAINRVTVAFAAASRETVSAYNERLKAMGVNKVVAYLPTAVDLELFRPRPRDECRVAMGLPVGVPIFVTVGRLAAVKGIPLLFEGLQRVREQQSDAMLLVIGDGELREELPVLAGKLGLGEAVRFLGNCPPEAVARAVNSADVCLCGSFTEGFSVAMVEQMACGRPIVSTPVSGTDELIQEGRNGFVVTSRDPAQFAQRMVEALRLPSAERISREIAEANYSDRRQWQRAMEVWPPLHSDD